MLNEPTDEFDLRATNKLLSPHCMYFPQGETNNFYIGSEDSFIYHSKIHTKNSNEGNIVQNYKGHQSAVMAIDKHPEQSKLGNDAKNLLLSCGTDWNIGIWNVRKMDKPVLMNYLDCEYYDVKWSPNHPSVFAACNCEGQIELWDLLSDTE